MGGFKLEQFKFALYVAVPIAAVYIFNIPAFFRAAIENRKYITYYPHDEDPDFDDPDVTISKLTPEQETATHLALRRFEARQAAEAAARAAATSATGDDSGAGAIDNTPAQCGPPDLAIEQVD